MGGARASDPLATFYNPAGLAGQDTKLTLQANVNIQKTCFTRLKANNDTTTSDGTNTSVTPGSSFPQVCNSGAPFPNPQIAFTYKLTNRIGLGLAVVGPSAAGQNSWPETVNGAPSPPALPPPQCEHSPPHADDRPRLGGRSIACASARASSGAWPASTSPNDAYLVNQAKADPALNDVRAELKVVDVFIPGFTLGTIWSPTDEIDIAGWYKYMSPIDAKGSVRTQVGQGANAAFTDTTESNCGLATKPQGTCGPNNAEAKINIPMEAKIGFRYHAPRQGAELAHRRDPMSQDIFDLEADLTWANNSSFSQIQILFPGTLGAGNNGGMGTIPVNGGGPPGAPPIGSFPPNASVPHEFQDVYGVRLGGDWNVLADQLAIRAGGYFQTSAQNAQYQNIDFPATSQVGLAAGGTYRIHLGGAPKKSAIEISLGIGHTFIATSTNDTQSGVPARAGTARATRHRGRLRDRRRAPTASRGFARSGQSTWARSRTRSRPSTSGCPTGSSESFPQRLARRGRALYWIAMTQTHPHKVIIIGSGPAGHTAGIYASRANLKPLLFEGMVKGGIPGGQLMITNDVENYPGFAEKITGPTLMAAFRAQAVHQGCDIRTEDVSKVDLSKRPFRVWAGDDNEEHSAETLILATGAQAKWLGLESEHALKGKGVSACAVCDGAFFRGQDVMVIGGGDTAMEESMYLSGLCKTVTLVHRRDEFRASKTMQDRVLKNPKIKVLYSTGIEEILDVSKGEVTGVRVRDLKTNTTSDVPVTGLFVAIGHTPNTDLFAGQLELHDNGYIRTKPGTAQTNVPGVFASGDVQDFVYRQAVTAAGTGCMAALDAERWLAANSGH